MNIIFGARRTGRTTQIIRRAHELKAYILVSDRNRALFIRKQADEMGLKDLLFPVTLAELLRCRNAGFVRDILIDDADDLLEALCNRQGWNVDTISICKREGKWAELLTPDEFEKACGGGGEK